MSKSAPQPDAKHAATGTEPADGAGGGRRGLLRFVPGFSRLQAWAGGNWARRGLVALSILGLIAGTVAAWVILARMALHSGQVPLSVALEAMDQGHTDQARALVGRMLTDGLVPHEEFGGPLFVLGAIKTLDAEEATSSDKRRVDFLVASRYLKEARGYGFPTGRENVGEYLLGKSLIESNQFEEGVEILDNLLSTAGTIEGPMSWGIHRLLAHTCLWMPEPELEKSLVHSNEALKNPQLSPNDRADTLIDRATCLSHLERADEARQSVDAISPESNRQAIVHLAKAQITLDEIEATLNKAAAQERTALIVNAGAKLDETLKSIDRAEALAGDEAQIIRRAEYLRGRALDLRGDAAGALREFTRLRQQFGESPEGLAAALNEADLRRRAGDFPEALLGYRRVLDGVPSLTTYRSVVLPLSNIRERILVAVADFRDRERFGDALTLLSRFTPLFSRTEELKYRGEMLEHWGNRLLSDVRTESWQPDEMRNEAFRRLREAGMAYEQLAEHRFATEAYVNDLWTGAENYYLGHNYSRAIELLNKFLNNAPELRNAQALLRIGQCYLALGKIPQSIAAFDECIEFHPRDSATYQARIECAKAQWYRGNLKEAEQLLMDNIAGSELKPSSKEWKDSQFQLGFLLHEKRDYEKAIGALEEAIARYESDAQTLLARYVIGESYRSLAEQLLERGESVATPGERNKNAELAEKQLQTALAYFIDVRKRITVEDQDAKHDPMKGAMVRNCYMLAGAVLFDLKRYSEAINAYSYVSSLYPNDPFVLETFVQISNCWRRLEQSDKARGAIQQAQRAFDELPADADFTTATAWNREEWRQLLADLAKL